MLGDPGTGKTCLIYRWTDDEYRADVLTTHTALYSQMNLPIPSGLVQFQIWDTTGQEKFLSLPPVFFRKANLCMLVYDIGDRHSFERLQFWRTLFLERADVQNDAEPPFVVLGNKCDTHRRLVGVAEGQQYAQEIKASFFEVSALTGVNVDKAFETAAERVVEICRNNQRAFALPRVVDLSGKAESWSCC
jgi:small GTP-binding protein